jgi:hypothetical protein
MTRPENRPEFGLQYSGEGRVYSKANTGGLYLPCAAARDTIEGYEEVTHPATNLRRYG